MGATGVPVPLGDTGPASAGTLTAGARTLADAANIAMGGDGVPAPQRGIIPPSRMRPWTGDVPPRASTGTTGGTFDTAARTATGPPRRALRGMTPPSPHPMRARALFLFPADGGAKRTSGTARCNRGAEAAATVVSPPPVALVWNVLIVNLDLLPGNRSVQDIYSFTFFSYVLANRWQNCFQMPNAMAFTARDHVHTDNAGLGYRLSVCTATSLQELFIFSIVRLLS